MKYMGSKNRLSKYIKPIIQKFLTIENIECYTEGFVGGANLIDKIDFKKKVGYDNTSYLIALLKYVQQHEDRKDYPEFITKEEYDLVKKNPNNYESYYYGLVGFLSSWNGRFFDGGYSGIRGKRNYYEEALKNLLKQRPNLLDIHFEVFNFFNLNSDIDINGNKIEKPKYLKNHVIYCDPPYANTKEYISNKKFNTPNFWDKVRELSKENIVIVSELTAPDDFISIWSLEKKFNLKDTNDVSNVRQKQAIENLFILKDLYEKYKDLLVS